MCGQRQRPLRPGEGMRGHSRLLRTGQVQVGAVHSTSLQEMALSLVQGDTSGCSKPPFDADVKVALYYKDLMLQRNFQINVNGRF